MGWEAWATLATVLVAVALMARDFLPPAAATMGALVILLVLGVVTPEEAFSGFGNPAPMTVAALYVLARAVEKTGCLQPILAATLGGTRGKRASLVRILSPTAVASAFLSNTPIVAMMVPQVTEWAQVSGRSPSLYLMPLSFAAILGGMVTAIGTSTNLVVSGLFEAHGLAPLGIFEITPVGLPVMLSGLVVLASATPWMLPERRPPRRQITEGAREFSVSMHVVPGGSLDGKAVEAGGLRHLQGVFLFEIQRGAEVIAPVSPMTVLRGGDRLVFVGKADLIVDLQNMRGLASAEERQFADLVSEQHAFFEVVVGAESPLLGKTFRQVNFRGVYQAAVVAIHRAGQRVRAKLGDVRLKVGDTLIVLADPGFRDRWRDRNDFLVIARLGGSRLGITGKAWIVALTGVLIVGIAGSGYLPILHASLIGAVGLVFFRVLTPTEARAAVDLNVIVLIASAFGLGAAMESSGLAARLATLLTGSLSAFGPTGALLGIVVATVVLTELITNSAAAALIFPIAISTAQALGLNPRPLGIAVAIAASASFLTPLGYQTNTMVYGPGGYRFTDYLRLGLPLTVVVIVVAVLVIPMGWPLR